MSASIEIRLYKPGESGEQPTFLGSEPVTVNDLELSKSEVWLENMLRRGRLEHAPDSPMDIRLIEGGYVVSLTGIEKPYRFSSKSLEFVAERLRSDLVKKQLIPIEETCTFRLAYAENAPHQIAESELWSGMTITVQKPELVLISGDLNNLISQSRVVDIPKGFITHQNKPFAVFYTEAAYAKAELFSRKGAVTNPLFESGCILLGYRGYSAEGGFFVVIIEAYEVMDAEQTLVSLTYSGTDWQRIMKIVEVRKKKEPQFGIIGQAHGHNYLPNNGECCKECQTREVCDVNNNFVSAADAEWHRAIFQNSPWAVCHIFGLTARADQINGLYTLHDGQLALRNFNVIPDFDHTQFETITTGKKHLSTK